MKTEYKMEVLERSKLVDTLNFWAEEGWTLSAAFPNHSKYLYNTEILVILERTIPVEVPSSEPMRMRNYG